MINPIIPGTSNFKQFPQRTVQNGINTTKLEEKKSPKSENIKHFLLFSSLDVILSALTYTITAIGCLGWGKRLFPKKAHIFEKYGQELSTGINTVINVGRVFVGQAVTPLSLGLATITPFIGNRIYRWADFNKEKRFTFADRTVHGIAIVAKASKRFTDWEDAKLAVAESFLSRVGRDITKTKLFQFLNTSRDPVTSKEHLKTIGSKLVSKYSWNMICFGLLDYLFKLFSKKD